MKKRNKILSLIMSAAMLITEDRKDDRYYAVGYIVADGKTYWSKLVEGIPNFEKCVNY